MDLGEMLVNCVVGTDLVPRFTTGKGFVQLIVDMTAVGGLWTGRFGYTTPERHVPLDVVTLYWSVSKLVHLFSGMLREICGCDDGPPLGRIPDLFSLINSDNGSVNSQPC